MALLGLAALLVWWVMQRRRRSQDLRYKAGEVQDEKTAEEAQGKGGEPPDLPRSASSKVYSNVAYNEGPVAVSVAATGVDDGAIVVSAGKVRCREGAGRVRCKEGAGKVLCGRHPCL